MLTTKGVLVNSAKWQSCLALQLYPQGSRKKTFKFILGKRNQRWMEKEGDGCCSCQKSR